LQIGLSDTRHGSISLVRSRTTPGIRQPRLHFE
jgi:hypothetical protein